MACEYCDRERRTTYDLRATIGETDADVELGFCSRACLAAWAAPSIDDDGLAVDGQPVR